MSEPPEAMLLKKIASQVEEDATPRKRKVTFKVAAHTVMFSNRFLRFATETEE